MVVPSLAFEICIMYYFLRFLLKMLRFAYLNTCTGSTSRLRRNVQNTHSLDPHSSHASDGEGVKWGVGVGVSIVGLVGVLAALAMCTHSAKSYDPDAPNNRYVTINAIHNLCTCLYIHICHSNEAVGSTCTCI